MRRGEIFSVSAPGDYGKPRPALVLQSDALNDLNIPSLVVCPMTSTLVDAPLIRISVNPSRENGLKKESQLMMDKIQAVSRARVGERVGKMDPKTMKRINQSLVFVLGLGE